MFENKKILIWGFGREGQSTKHFLSRCANPESVEVFEGKREDIDADKYDIIVKSPGIVLNEDNPKFTSQTEIFLQAHRDKVIGVTGTKGKSTTSSMLYHVLSKCLPEKKVILLGNIGEPCLDYFDEIDDDTIVVFEMSCHQLKHTSVSPHVSVFLNLYEEHLDYYKTFENYFEAKKHVTLYQSEEDYFFVGDEVPEFDTKAQKIVINWGQTPKYSLKVLGEHNNYNAYFVYKIATTVYNIDGKKVEEALTSFEGLLHRLQYLGEVDGIDFYDDSISTIPNAAIKALESVENAKTILIGGMDRGINYDVLIDFINNHHEFNYIFSYDSGKRIFDSIKKSDNCFYVPDLEGAVFLAKEITEKGQAVLLSPASASYGYFKNFEQRGEMFREYAGFQ